MNDFRCGSTRYIDWTAKQAIDNLEFEERKKLRGGVNYMTTNKAGEIWEIETTSGFIKYAVVIADNGEICNILVCGEDPKYCDIEINCKGKMFCDSRKVAFSMSNRMVNFVRKLTDEEFNDIIIKVVDSLGFAGMTIEKVIEKPVEIIREVATPTASNADLLELASAKAQLDVYKELYHDLLNSIKGVQ